MEVEPFRAVLSHLTLNGSLVPLLPGDSSNRQDVTWEEVRGGRAWNALRTVMFATDVSASVQGSSVCCLGGTKVSVSVLGPLPLLGGSSSSSLYPGAASAPSRQDLGLEVTVSYALDAAGAPEDVASLLDKAKRVVNETADEFVTAEQRNQRLPLALLECLKSVVDKGAYVGGSSSVLCVSAVVLAEDGEDSVTVCALNALSLALARAGVHCHGVAGTAAGAIVTLPQREPVICLDLSARERRYILDQAGGRITSLILSIVQNTQDVLYLSMQGNAWKEPYNQKLLRLTSSAAQAMAEQIKTCISGYNPE